MPDRKLVVGSSPVNNAMLVCSILESESAPATVITSYSNSVLLYKQCPRVTQVVTYKDFDEKTIAENGTVVVDVLASSFLDHPYVKRIVKLIVVSTMICNKEGYSDVFIGKTIGAKKQQLYYSAFVDHSKQTFEAFSAAVKSLASNQYMTVLGKIETCGKTSDKIESIQKIESSPKSEPSLKIEPKPDQNDEAKSVSLAFDIAVNPAYKVSDVIMNLKDMLENELVASMIKDFQTESQVLKSSQNVTVKLDIYETRQDLFASLGLHMLQSLRTSGMILSGAIRV